MESLKLIDSILESISTNEANSDSRFAYLLFLFTQLKRFNFAMPDLDEKTTDYITEKFASKFFYGHLNELQKTFVFMDIRLAASLILDKEKEVVELPKYKEPEPISVKVDTKPNTVTNNTKYDPESDVLEEEGLIEPPPKREMVYNKEFMKSLGMLDE